MNTPPHEPLRIVGICGSLRAVSYTRMALTEALAGARALGAETELIDLRHYALVFCDGSKQEAQRAPDVARLQAQVRAAHGILLGTPEYHSGYSGVLKNALDLMGFEELGGKVMGLVAVSGGGMGAANALNALRVVGRSLHAWVVPEQVSIAQASKQFDAAGRAVDADLAERLHAVGRQVARFAYLHSSQQAQEFLRLWETAPANPGGR
ncbi:MAG: NAD(P)H-dependent oxidoreductase [Caldilineales bacterium]|nr:NAD(P)H-dependent oxidoreductase [Caldilineales bacterium]